MLVAEPLAPVTDPPCPLAFLHSSQRTQRGDEAPLSGSGLSPFAKKRFVPSSRRAQFWDRPRCVRVPLSCMLDRPIPSGVCFFLLERWPRCPPLSSSSSCFFFFFFFFLFRSLSLFSWPCFRDQLLFRPFEGLFSYQNSSTPFFIFFPLSDPSLAALFHVSC